MAVSSRAGSQVISFRFCKRRVNVLWDRRTGRTSGISRASVRRHRSIEHAIGRVGRSDRRQHGRGSRRPQINFTVPEAVIQAGRSDLMGDVCDCLIPSQPPKEAIEARRRKANQAVTEDDDHYHTIANPAKGEKLGERGAGPVKPTGYRPGRKIQKRQQGKKR
jgi:hypothetical protein